MRIIIWCIYLILFPFKIEEEGSVQIADYFMVVGIFINLIISGVGFTGNFNKYLLVLLIYILIINSIYYYLFGDLLFIKSSFNYIYCVLALFLVIDISKKKDFIKATSISIFISFLIQLFFIYLNGINFIDFRQKLFFNDPNQLGYWGLNALTIYILFYIQNNQNKYLNFLYFLGIIISLLFIILSISQSAMISASVLLIIYLFLLFKKNKSRFLFYFIIFIINASIYSQNIVNNILFSNIKKRFEMDLFNPKEKDNSFEGRYYDRIYKYPEYLILGAGEGKFERFNLLDPKEIHSTFGNILFSYGLIGLIILLIPFLILIKDPFSLFSFTLIGYLLFTLTTNTSRWVLFWVVSFLIIEFKKRIASKEFIC